MGYCGNCGTLISNGWKFCSRCGANGRPEVCPDCGTILREEWSFCPHCGGRIEQADADTTELVLPIELLDVPISAEEREIASAEEEPVTPAPVEEAERFEAEEEAVTPTEETEESLDALTEQELPSWDELYSEPETEQAEPMLSDEEQKYAGLIAKREALRGELKALDGRLSRLNSMDEEFAKLPAGERIRIREERREIRIAQGRCHAQLLQIARMLRTLAEQEANRGRAIFSREHPELICPQCSNKLRKGVDTWPFCSYCGKNVTEQDDPAAGAVLLKLRCGESGLKRVWYSGDVDFFEYWKTFHDRHRRHEYRYSADCAVLTVELAGNRGAFVKSGMPDELPATHILLRREPDETDSETENADGMRTVSLGALDMTDLSEGERFSFLRLLQTDEPDRERRKFTLK